MRPGTSGALPFSRRPWFMNTSFQKRLVQQLEDIRAAGTYKTERIITTPQGARIHVANGRPVLNFCANNYLGLAGHPAAIQAAREALDRWGYGLSPVRFIRGPHSIHQALERQ